MKSARIRGPRKAKAFWGEEEQRNEYGVTFYKKESRHKRYEACDDDGAAGGIWTHGWLLTRWISSPCRYDLFGTAAYKLGEIILYCFYYFVNIASDYILW